ncbi:hypothetical protein EX30DRAFT_338938 [Ascodesmis nigricans]|uniref:Uncharacterized protein n=1 Tax=Ascodesmis nigricans TaxID=341454 RepID=A0A4S2N5B8_9PEZI|nr:hypothetical protein EX30DRAFT_338938 [Ascodesmis nigricans]
MRSPTILLLFPRIRPIHSSVKTLRLSRAYTAATSASPTTASKTSIEQLRKTLLASHPTTEPALLDALKQLRNRAEERAVPKPTPIDPTPSSPTAAILSQAQEPSPTSPPPQNEPDDVLPDIAFTLLKQITDSGKLTLTPPILESYIHLCSATSTPSAIPPALALYTSPSPTHPRNAVPTELAQLSLLSSLNNRDLPASLDIIDLTFSSPAFINRKRLTRALPSFLLGGFLLPATFWSAATTLAEYQDTFPLETARQYAFIGLLCYGAFTGGLGLVAVTTRNDQMRRVRWLPGTPLRKRWEREEERQALDAVALWWGFKEKERWGGEQGDEWELLRSVVGRKGMVLDAPASMPGMQ